MIDSKFKHFKSKMIFSKDINLTIWRMGASQISFGFLKHIQHYR